MSGGLEGKVILLTGATEGIGKAAAYELAARGATLVLVARNREKGERLVTDLAAQSGNRHIELLTGDLSKIDEVRSVAAAFRARHQRLDVLINNAGAMFTKQRLSADGLEMTFALNHLAYFVLTRELLDLLERTPGSRIINTSSDAHRRGRLDPDTIARRPAGKAGFSAYSDSKLANILFTRELARRIAGTGVTVNAFHPGFVRTGFGKNDGWLMGLGIGIAGVFARGPKKGAETMVWLATSDQAAPFSGEYFHDCRVTPTTAAARDDVMAAKLWELSEKLAPSGQRATA